MKLYEDYYNAIRDMLDKIMDTQSEQIEQAADIVADAIAAGGLLHTLGVGHSHCVTEDVFWRAGTLAPVHAILEPSMIGSTEVTKSAYMEKLEGAGKIICDYHKVDPPDALLAVSNSANNAMPIDVAMECKRRGVKVIAVCSLTYADSLKARHSSGLKLSDVADVVIDNCGEVGDTCLKLDSIEQGVGPSSTITGSFAINAFLVQAAENLQERGVTPEVWWSGNLEGGMEANAAYHEKYWGRIRNL